MWLSFLKQLYWYCIPYNSPILSVQFNVFSISIGLCNLQINFKMKGFFFTYILITENLENIEKHIRRKTTSSTDNHINILVYVQYFFLAQFLMDFLFLGFLHICVIPQSFVSYFCIILFTYYCKLFNNNH